MPRSMQLHKERIATDTPGGQAGVFVVRRHHLLVRCSHWLNVPILRGLILSGLSIYWASPVYQHKPDPLTGNVDRLADIGIWISHAQPPPRTDGFPSQLRGREIANIQSNLEGGRLHSMPPLFFAFTKSRVSEWWFASLVHLS